MPKLRQFAVIFAATLTMLPSAGAAQEPTYVTAPPAEQYTMSPGGVDMRTGKYAYRMMDLSAGPDGAGIKLERMEDPAIPGHMAPFANMSHNWDIMLTERRRNLVSHAIVDAGYSDYQVYVSFGGRTETFRALAATWPFERSSSSAFATLNHTGARGAGGEVYTYTNSGGSTIVFRPLGTSGNSDCSATVRCAYPSHMTLADGTKFTFDYETRTATGSKARIKAVTSNRGYKLLFEYGSTEWNLITKACLYNVAVSVAPSSTCDSSALASTNYSYTTFSSTAKLASVTDAASGVWNFSYFTDGSTPSGKHKMGYFRPGEVSPWQVNLVGYEENYFLVPEEVVWKQDYIDGSSWTYAFDRTPTIFNPPPGQPQNQIAGGHFQDQDGRVTSVEFAFPEMPYSMTAHVAPPSTGQLIYNYYMNPQNGSSWRIPATNSGDPVVIMAEEWQDTFRDILFGWQLGQLVQCYDCSGASSYYLHLSYQITPGPVSVTDPLGRTSTFDYCRADASFPAYEPYNCLVGQIQSATDAEGRKTEYSYNGYWLTKVRKITKPGTALPDIVAEAFYTTVDCNATPKICDKPTSTKDPRGNVTNFTYDPAHGGVLTEVGPAVNGVSPAKKYAYVQRTAWIKNSGSGYSAESNPVWLLSEERSCNTSALDLTTGTCAAGASDLVVVSYDYGPNSGPNNLLLRSKAITADGQTLRTCYSYDAIGNVISETSPRGTCS